jgi:hypothetical protein
VAIAQAEERFWKRVEITDGCWLWPGTRNAKGYCQFSVDGKKIYVHRFAYELLVGPIPEGQELDHRHTCPKNCVRPTHLRVVTHKQNNENRVGAHRDSKSGVRGVHWNKGAWEANVCHSGKHIYVGRFKTVEEAEAAVIAKRLEVFTHNDADRGSTLHCARQ